ncbi:MAG TPA: hypothetical protein VM165_22590 [Planctomycetaceae bacterium]|nr:hypothetical protein [Planctomycetaceae bacterium]
MSNTLVTELRDLILRAAPQPELAQGVMTCDESEPLDRLMPFSSVIILGVLVAIEDRYQIAATKTDVRHVLTGGVTLQRLAEMIEAKLAATT